MSLAQYNKKTKSGKVSADKYRSIYNNSAKKTEFLNLIGSKYEPNNITYTQFKNEIRYNFGETIIKAVVNNGIVSDCNLVKKTLQVINFTITDFSRWLEPITIAKYNKLIAVVPKKVAKKQATKKIVSKVSKPDNKTSN